MNPVIFVSSTYLDLKEIRKDVIRWINEFQCTPIGMEFFGSAPHILSYIYDRINSCTNFSLSLILVMAQFLKEKRPVSLNLNMRKQYCQRMSCALSGKSHVL